LASIGDNGGSNGSGTCASLARDLGQTHRMAKSSVTVTGHGRAAGRPDTAVVSLGVEVRAAVAVDALTRANQRAAALIAAVRELGVAPADLVTRDVSLYPQFGDNGQQVIGYVAGNQVSATIRDIDRVGEILDGAVRQVGDEVRFGGISFSIDDPSALTAAARAAAVADARQKATQLAELAGARLGRIVAMQEGGGAMPSTPKFARAMAMDGAVPIEAGSQAVAVDVVVSFRLESD
jgi:uncharacterized protein YggE